MKFWLRAFCLFLIGFGFIGALGAVEASATSMYRDDGLRDSVSTRSNLIVPDAGAPVVVRKDSAITVASKQSLTALVVAAETVPGVDATTAALQGHVDAAVADYNSGAIGMSLKQQLAAAADPGLESAFRGSVIDSAAKARILADPGLSHLYVTPNFTFGPDVFDATGNWWDMTTEGQWQAHVDKYMGHFGTSGIRLPTG